MALNPGQKALADAFMRRTLRLRPQDAERLGVPETERCGLTPNSGGTVNGDGRTVARSAYTLKLPADTPLHSLPEDLQFTIDQEPGRIFTIVWAPAATNLNLSRAYEVDEDH
ncbi:MAG TPA: hypothetical protein VEA41_07985 [Salinarimonas sp.]|nr:hypothetical protein [Salinarimonas sp.]